MQQPSDSCTIFSDTNIGPRKKFVVLVGDQSRRVLNDIFGFLGKTP